MKDASPPGDLVSHPSTFVLYSYFNTDFIATSVKEKQYSAKKSTSLSP